jgi:TetR/AcrR family fatty acid metabolism transcriptional regulator
MRSPARQRQILDCAKRVFAERGFHAANISHICEAAGIGRGTLYQYFRNKKSVFTAILRETLDRVRALMERQRGGRFPRPERLTRQQVVDYSAQGLREILGVVFDDDHTLRILLREAVGLDVDIEKILGEIDEALIGIVAGELARARDAGIVRDLDPRITATLMVGAIEKLALAALRSDAPVDLDALAREAATLHGIGTLSDRVR